MQKTIAAAIVMATTYAVSLSAFEEGAPAACAGQKAPESYEEFISTVGSMKGEGRHKKRAQYLECSIETALDKGEKPADIKATLTGMLLAGCAAGNVSDSDIATFEKEAKAAEAAADTEEVSEPAETESTEVLEGTAAY